ncbi:FxsA family protein [Marinobacteraceae bacterium S3BR75-40.1]
MRFLFLLFIVLPILETVVLIKVGGIIGAWPTVGLVLLTAMIGASMLKQQGLATLLRANQRLESGELPAREVAEGFLLAIGGALLLTPGFITDAIGFLCLAPGSRHLLAAAVLKRAVVSGQGFSFHYRSGPRPGPDDMFGRGGPFRGPDGHDVIDGEYEREDSNPRNDRDGIEKK